MIRNYWLTEFAHTSKDEEDPEDEIPEDEDPDDPEAKLNPRQKMMYDNYEMCVEEHGKFDQSAKGNGAHYAPGSKNPFIKEGLMCSNCVFYMGGQACEIVSGKVDPQGVCKLWIIPEELVKK